MDDSPENICQYFYEEECPYQLAFSKAILIPQLLEQKELDKARELCKTCEKCRDEKRKSLRIKRPLKVTVNNDRIRNMEGTMVDISSTGALIELEDSFDLKAGELLEVIIYSSGQDRKTKHIVRNQPCVVKRLEKQGYNLAVMFLNEKK